MRARIQVLCVVLAVVLLGRVVTLAADPPGRSRFQNVRVTEPDLSLAVTTCYENSVTCRRLLDEIESSTTIVYVRTALSRTSTRTSCLTLMTGSADYRYLRITLDPALRGDRVVVMLSHELQHAVEVVRMPDVVDADTMRALYRAIGYSLGASGTREDWETLEAKRVAGAVSDELHRARKVLVQARR